MTMPRRALVIVFFFILLNLVNTKAALSLTYFNFQEWGGTWHDVDKGDSDGKDKYMCWAAAASNILYWGGWYTPTYNSARLIFRNFQEHWSNRGSMVHYGWNWWLNQNLPPGTLDSRWSKVCAPGGGGYWPNYNFQKFFHKFSRDDNPYLMLAALDYYLHSGCGVIVGIYKGTLGHTLTAWGYEYHYGSDQKKIYTKLFVTDSDDHEIKLCSYEIAWNAGVNQWEFKNGRYPGWRIEEVEALEKRPEEPAKPVPSTLAQKS